LKELDDEVVRLKERIRQSQEQLKDATNERMARITGADLEQLQKVAKVQGFNATTRRGSDLREVGEDGDLEDDGEEWCDSSRASSKSIRMGGVQSSEKRGSLGDEDGDGDDDFKEQMDKFTSIRKSSTQSTPDMEQTNSERYKAEVLSPLLLHRRAESSFREAKQCHETAVSHMRSEIAALERRIAKQQLWLNQIDDMVLKVEIEKVSSTVRLQSATKRADGLSQDLCKAYEHMSRLLRERLEVEGMAAQNDALVGYLNLIRTADVQNEANFIENKTELKKLLDICKTFRECQERYNKVMEEVRQKENLTKAITTEVEKLLTYNEELQKLWIMVPASLKESIFRRRGTVVKTVSNIFPQQDGNRELALESMHPATVLNTISSSLSRIDTEEKHYASLLADIREQTDPLLNMDPTGGTMITFRKGERVSIVADDMKKRTAGVVLEPNLPGAAVKVQMADGSVERFMEHELRQLTDLREAFKPNLTEFCLPPPERIEDLAMADAMGHIRSSRRRGIKTVQTLDRDAMVRKLSEH
jgi:hypothetical protein